jgi:hypothetical protein
MDIAATAGLVSGVQQSQTQSKIGMALLRSALHERRDAVNTLLSDVAAGGQVTATRGQKLNTVA